MRTEHSLNRIVLRGKVISGRGWAKHHLAKVKDELTDLVREQLAPGSMNIILYAPIRLNNKTARLFDSGIRLLWPGKIFGKNVWLYRWTDAPLHIVEVLADCNLRSRFGLEDNDNVEVEVDKNDTEPIHWISKIAWRIAWGSHREKAYSDDEYLHRMRFFCKNYDATQELRGIGKLKMVGSTLKSVLKRIPIFGPFAKYVFGKSPRAEIRADLYSYQPLVVEPNEDLKQTSLRKVKNILNYTKTSNSAYSAKKFPGGYHSMTLPDAELVGQRIPAKRLELVPIDFSGKTVLDIGSNQGGMLFAIREKLRWGVGIDYDARMVNAANRVAAYTNTENLRYYVFDLEKEPLDFIENFLPEAQVDVCFLLSVCMWLTNWKEVINKGQQLSRSMLFETNGTDEQQQDQISCLREIYGSVQQLVESSEDDPSQKLRMMFYCTSPLQSN